MPWPCEPDPANKYIVHFPDEPSIWSYGSGYGGNALLGKKCLALRIASVVARKEGWLAEHMLILGLTSPEGKKHYIAGAFPSACGKTNLAMMQPTLPGWKVTCVGDDIAWMRIGEDGRLYAMNPETGFFGVAPGTSHAVQPERHGQRSATNSIFTNVALTDEGDVWWEDMGVAGSGARSSTGRATTGRRTRAARPLIPTPASPRRPRSARSSTPTGRTRRACRSRPFLFGGRRASTIPLVNEAFDWEHGVFMGSAAGSETTAADLEQDRRAAARSLRHAALLRLQHGRLLRPLAVVGRSAPTAPSCPKVFFVNWFRKGDDGHWLWPGYGENSRVLKWIFERVEGERRSGRDPHRQPAGSRTRSTSPAWTSRPTTCRRCSRSTSRAGRTKRPVCPSTTTSSATGCRPRFASNWPPCRTVSR